LLRNAQVLGDAHLLQKVTELDRESLIGAQDPGLDTKKFAASIDGKSMQVKERQSSQMWISTRPRYSSTAAGRVKPLEYQENHQATRSEK
jgi:hypothetical protein